MRKITILSALLLVAACSVASALQPVSPLAYTNVVWAVTDETGTNDLGHLDKQGNMTIGGTISACGTNTTAEAFTATGAITTKNARVWGTAYVNAVTATGTVTMATKPVLTINSAVGTNTGVLTECPAGTANAKPVWFKVTWTNGSDYAVPGWLLP